MKPQDLVILLKLISLDEQEWSITSLAQDLSLSEIEISDSLKRSTLTGLIYGDKNYVQHYHLMNFLEFGVRFVFPQIPGKVVKGVATAHSAPPLKSIIKSSDSFVWPSSIGTSRGHTIQPLYSAVVKSTQTDTILYEYLTLVDVLRVAREPDFALSIKELRKRILLE